MIYLFALLGLVCFYLILVNKRPKTSFYRLEDKNLPKAFDGLRILQVSDFHNSIYGRDQVHIMKAIEKEDFDLIFITGDLVDRRRLDLEVALDFIDRIRGLAPIFYANGNHELGIGENYDLLKKGLRSRGVIVLENDIYSWEKEGQTIDIVGLVDPRVYRGKKKDRRVDEDKRIAGFIEDLDLKNYSLVLAHRPEKFLVYVDQGLNIVFTGHAHGGQARFFKLAGYSPDQGILPSYTRGVWGQGQSQMVISRGLGNSRFPLRIFNRSELVLVEIRR